MVKACSSCKLEKPSSAFYADKSKVSGLASRCKKCMRPYFRARQARIRKENPEKSNRLVREFNWRRKLKLITYYGGKCQCCGELNPKFLAIDHINGNGNQHRREMGFTGGSQPFYAWLVNNGFPEGFQVLCHNCNMAKAYYKVCPHQEQKAAV